MKYSMQYNISKIKKLSFILFCVLTSLFSSPSYSLSNFTINHITIQVEKVSSPAALAQGLSGRKSLGENQGMLFIFPTEGIYPFWMKDMLFAIDIIWMDKNYNIVYVKENAQPCTLFNCPVYKPNKPAQYVLEVEAGWARLHGVV